MNLIEVIYPLPDYQHKFPVYLSEQDLKQYTILDVINKSGILEFYPEIDLNINILGVFGELRQLSDKVAKDDRIEIYRPLLIDPMQARRLRASKQKDK